MNVGVRKRFLVVALGTLAVFAAIDWSSRADDAPPAARRANDTALQRKPAKQKKPLLSKFMRAKLTASSQVLEGLCTEDYALIEKGARKLSTVSRAEQWRVSNDAIYRQHSAEFRRGVDKLMKAAKKKQLDSVALAWTKTTLNCIECHRWMKGMLISDK